MVVCYDTGTDAYETAVHDINKRSNWSASTTRSLVFKYVIYAQSHRILDPMCCCPFRSLGRRVAYSGLYLGQHRPEMVTDGLEEGS
jgi:hypothetical protein